MSIVVATDFSPATAAMGAKAAHWASRLCQELVLLHVVHDPLLAPALTGNVHADVEEARRRLRTLAAGLPPGTMSAIEVQAADDVAEGILARVRRPEVQFLFLCSSSKSMLDRLRLGSIAAKVVRASPVPVVCCPPS